MLSAFAHSVHGFSGSWYRQCWLPKCSHSEQCFMQILPPCFRQTTCAHDALLHKAQFKLPYFVTISRSSISFFFFRVSSAARIRINSSSVG